MKSQTIIAFALLVVPFTPALSQAPQTPVQPAGNTAPQDPFSMDLDSLSSTKVTTASKFPEKLSDAPSVITVVSQDEIARFGGITLAEILTRVAGLNLSSGFFQDRSTVAVDGDQSRVNSGHVLFLINGRPVREVLEGGIGGDLLESFPVNALEKIEVIKGPGSVLYGSGAFSGVINLITRKAVGKSVRVRAAGGAGGAAAGSAEVSYSKGDLNVMAAGQYHQFPVWQTGFSVKLDPAGPNSSQNASTRTISLPDNGEGGYLGVTYKGFSLMSSYTGLVETGFVPPAVGDIRLRRGFTDVGYSIPVSSKWEMGFNFTYSRNVSDAPAFPSIHRDSYEALLEWTNSVTFSNRDHLTFGALANHAAGTETFIGSNPVVIDSKGHRNGTEVYAELEHQLSDSWKLVGGFQVNKTGSIDPDVVPRFGIVWTPTDQFTVKTLYGGAYRAPSLNENFVNHGGLIGDLNLKPESVRTLDLQASYQTRRFQLSAVYFHSRQKNLIVITAAQFPAVIVNLPFPATFQGAELEGKYYFQKNWFAMGSALYQVNHDPAIAILSPIPSFSAKAGVSYAGRSGATLSIFDSYQGHTPGYATSLNPDSDAVHSVSAHLRYDLSKRWFKSDKHGLAPFIYADNLTNTPVWLPYWGAPYADTMPVNRGRTVFFGIEFWQKAE